MANHDKRLCRCSNCAWTGREDHLRPVQDLHERVEVGEIMPAGECPQCGCLAHLAGPTRQTIELALLANVSWIEAHHKQAGFTWLPSCAKTGRKLLDEILGKVPA